MHKYFMERARCNNLALSYFSKKRFWNVQENMEVYHIRILRMRLESILGILKRKDML